MISTCCEKTTVQCLLTPSCHVLNANLTRDDILYILEDVREVFECREWDILVLTVSDEIPSLLREHDICLLGGREIRDAVASIK